MVWSLRLFDGRVPVIHEFRSPGKGWSPRNVPCSASICSFSSDSVRARTARAPFVDGGHRSLFIVGQGHDPEREDLVDLGAVEELAGALGCDLEDSRRE